MEFHSFPSINQYRHVVESVTHKATFLGRDEAGEPRFDTTRTKPVLRFRGTVKLHGTNCGLAYDLVSDQVFAQSKERYITPQDDNFGFAAWAFSEAGYCKVMLLRAVVRQLAMSHLPGPAVALHVFGEWCGPEVNAKTAIGKLDTRWVVFGVRATLADGQEHWLPVEDLAALWKKYARPDEPGRVFFITDYPGWVLDIDFNEPGLVLDELEQLTLAVEASCPVAQAMGLAGLGEGIVWICEDPKFGRLVFKTKGLKHKGTRSSRVAEVAPEVLKGVRSFVDAVVTDSRLEQGFDLLRSQHGKVTLDHMGDFLAWVGRDILKEEGDTLSASGLERKQVMGAVTQRAKAWLTPRLALF